MMILLQVLLDFLLSHFTIQQYASLLKHFAPGAMNELGHIEATS